MARKIIAVVGGTGAQGSGLVRAICEDPEQAFAARVLTRDPGSPKARELQAMGAETVEADLARPESIRAAFEGAYGAYCVTFFWDHFSPERELRDAGTMACAAAATGLQHVIWSTLEDARQLVPLDDDRMPTLKHRYKVPHTDAKGEANSLFTDSGVPTTFLLTSFYWENFIHFGSGPQRLPDGRLALIFPLGAAKLPGIAAEDIGRCALGIFKRGPDMIGRTVGIAGEHLTGAEMAALMSEQLRVDIGYSDMPPEQYRQLGFPGADDLANMFQFKRDFNELFCAARSVETSRELNPRLQDFRAWLTRYGSQIPLPQTGPSNVQSVHVRHAKPSI